MNSQNYFGYGYEEGMGGYSQGRHEKVQAGQGGRKMGENVKKRFKFSILR